MSEPAKYVIVHLDTERPTVVDFGDDRKHWVSAREKETAMRRPHVTLKWREKNGRMCWTVQETNYF